MKLSEHTYTTDAVISANQLAIGNVYRLLGSTVALAS